MEDKKGKESSEARPRYVWDPNKLAWVETVEGPPVKEPAERRRKEPIAPKAPVEQPREEDAEEAVSEDAMAEAIVEAPVLEYRGAWLRLAAYIIDFIILTIIVAIISAVTTIPSWSATVVGFVYFMGFWSWRGQTPGKMVIGAKIVKTDGNPINPVNAFLRYLFYLIPTFAPALGLAASIKVVANNFIWLVLLAAIVGMVVIGFSSSKRGIHDLIAGTCVINTRSGLFQRGRRGESDEVEPYETSEPKADKTETDNQT